MEQRPRAASAFLCALAILSLAPGQGAHVGAGPHRVRTCTPAPSDPCACAMRATHHEIDEPVRCASGAPCIALTMLRIEPPEPGRCAHDGCGSARGCRPQRVEYIVEFTAPPACGHAACCGSDVVELFVDGAPTGIRLTNGGRFPFALGDFEVPCGAIVGEEFAVRCVEADPPRTLLRRLREWDCDWCAKAEAFGR